MPVPSGSLAPKDSLMDKPVARSQSDRRRSSKAAEPVRRFDVADPHHGIEREVRQILTSQPGLSFPSLVVHRVGDGVCLTGVMECTGEADVCGLVRQVAGVNRVIDRLIVRGGAAD